MQIVAQVADRAAFTLAEIHGECAIGLGDECAFVGQVIELQRHAFAVRFGETEAERAEGGGQEGGVELALGGGRVRQPVVEKVLQHEQAGDVGLGLFDGAVELLQFLPRRGGASVDLNLVRADSVAQFVRQDVGEEVIEAQILARRLGEHAGGDGGQVHFELGLLNILQHHPLAALLLDHALIVRQVEGGGANAVRAIPGRQHLVHYADGRSGAQLGIAILRVDGQVVLHLLQMVGEHRQPRGLAVRRES